MLRAQRKSEPICPEEWVELSLVRPANAEDIVVVSDQLAAFADGITVGKELLELDPVVEPKGVVADTIRIATDHDVETFHAHLRYVTVNLERVVAVTDDHLKKNDGRVHYHSIW